MENLKIEVEETKTYKQRMQSLLWFPFICFYGLPLFFYFSNQSKPLGFNGLILFLLIDSFMFAITTFSCNVLCTYSITVLEIKENNVHIIYTKKDESFELNDSIEKFEFSEGRSQGIGSYLKIRYNNEFSIKQLNKWGWRREKAYYPAINYLRNRNLLGMSFYIVK